MKKHLLKTILLLFALVAGSTSSWAADETWTHTFVSPEAISDNSITVDNATWTVTTTKGQGSPTMTAGKSYSKYGLKFGSKGTVYYGSVTFSTDYFNSYNVKSVKINVLNNGKQEGTLTVKQGDVNIGSASQTFGNSWTDLTANTNTGAGGALSFTYSVQQAFYINSITVTYTTGGGSSPDPVASIDLGSNSIEAPAAGASGTIEVTYNNITEVASEVQFFKADGTTPATYDWVNAEINKTSNNVDYTIDANTGEARTAYMKVYALDDEANEVYSKLITITQAEIPTSWAAVTSIADLTTSDVFVIVGNNGSTYALPNDKGTSAAPTVVAVTVANNALSGTVADNIKWNISGNATDGYTFYPDGDTEKWLYCTNENNGLRVGTNTNKTFTLDNSGYLKHVGTSRYVGIYKNQDWRCYTGNGGNIENQTLAFYKKLAVKFNKEGYATFSSTCAIDYSKAEGWTAWVVTGVSGSAITFSQVTGAVPAGTGVLLMGTAGETVYPEVAESGEEPDVNKLRGITTATAVYDEAYYGLSGNEFVKVNAGTVPAGKALLPADAVVGGVKALSFRFDGADGISEIMTNGENEKMSAIYDLSGRRVVKPTKGLYIVNGKKVVK